MITGQDTVTVSGLYVFHQYRLLAKTQSCPLSLQAIINSTITPNMTFTKTSQKFGQWADSRANTVYGLGFATEQQLNQVNLPAAHVNALHVKA